MASKYNQARRIIDMNINGGMISVCQPGITEIANPPANSIVAIIAIIKNSSERRIMEIKVSANVKVFAAIQDLQYSQLSVYSMAK